MIMQPETKITSFIYGVNLVPFASAQYSLKCFPAAWDAAAE
jgi:hypothetical protein